MTTERKTEETIRNLFNACESDKVESLLVQCADWGINIRMFLNGKLLELDLMKNYEGYEVTFVEDRDKGPVQIDELSDLRFRYWNMHFVNSRKVQTNGCQ